MLIKNPERKFTYVYNTVGCNNTWVCCTLRVCPCVTISSKSCKTLHLSWGNFRVMALLKSNVTCMAVYTWSLLVQGYTHVLSGYYHPRSMRRVRFPDKKILGDSFVRDYTLISHGNSGKVHITYTYTFPTAHCSL